MKPAQHCANWADKLRDISAAGLFFCRNEDDLARYRLMQESAIQLMALATGRSPDEIAANHKRDFTFPCPRTWANALIIDDNHILLRPNPHADNWTLPGGPARLDKDSPAQTARVVAAEQLNITVEPIVLLGLFESRFNGADSLYHFHEYSFLCTTETPQDVETGRWVPLTETASLVPPHIEQQIQLAQNYQSDPNFQPHFEWEGGTS